MSFRKKIVDVPIKIHIYKYLLVHGTWNEENVLISSKVFYGIRSTNKERIDDYMSNLDKKVMVKVQMTPSSIYHQYAMIQYFEERFKREMFAFIDVRKDQDRVFAPLREFYAKYDIYPSDYDFDTAFKRYQREVEKRKKQKPKNEQRIKALR